MKIIILMLACCFSFIANSQQVQGEAKKIKFTSINQFGLLTGDAGTSYDIKTINGISKGKWALGAGIGIDAYVARSVPIFLDVRRDFGKGNNVPFLYADAGLNFTWLSTVQKENKGLPYSTTPGLYMDAGIGIKFKTKTNANILLSAGYTYKQTKETVNPPVWILPWPIPGQPNNDNAERLNSHFRRIVVRLGIQI